MTTQELLKDLEKLKTEKLFSERDEKILVLDTLKTIALLTEAFRNEVKDLRIPVGERESLEWDADLARFVFHRGECARFLDIAGAEILLKVRPFLSELMLLAKESLS